MNQNKNLNMDAQFDELEDFFMNTPEGLEIEGGQHDKNKR